MKIVRIGRGRMGRYAVVEGDTVYAMVGSPFEEPRKGAELHKLDEALLLPPCEPKKIICIAPNYRTHAEEQGIPLPETPILFIKPPTTLLGQGGKIVHPPATQQLEHEAELTIVIGRQGKDIPLERAREYILGYTCGNDVTARDIQNSAPNQLVIAKSFDTFCPLGPWIVTDLNPSDLALTCRVNGQVVQDSRTSDMAFGVEWLVSFVSGIMTLEPGDVILTGTPGGTSVMHPGDEVEVEIEGIGVMRNEVVSA
jgi:2-keto-4-pentenoate hydratase/2-oxohepta-3-ene-1,7-dioic acid hydratase in catechol pathway